MTLIQVSEILGGGFKHILCSPLFGEDEPILTIIFFKGIRFSGLTEVIDQIHKYCIAIGSVANI